MSDKERTIAALDLGANGLRIAVADVAKGGTTRILTILSHSGPMYRRNVTAGALRRLLRAAEVDAKRSMKDVWISVGGGCLQWEDDVAVNAPSDVRSWLQTGFCPVLGRDRYVVNVFPDGRFARVVTFSTATVARHIELVESAGLRIAGFCCEPYASFLGVGVAPSRDCAVIDLGGATSKLAASLGGHIVLVDNCSIGGEQATQDIAKELKVQRDEAEDLKLGPGVDVRPGAPGVVSAVLHERVIEILELCHRMLERRGITNVELILTGGACVTPRLPELAEDVFGQSVTIASSIRLDGRDGETAPPSAATVLGLVRYACGEGATLESSTTRRPLAARPPSSRVELRDGRAVDLALTHDGFQVALPGFAARGFPATHRGLVLAARTLERAGDSRFLSRLTNVVRMKRSPASRWVAPLTDWDGARLLNDASGPRADDDNDSTDSRLAQRLSVLLRQQALAYSSHVRPLERAVEVHGVAPIIYCKGFLDDEGLVRDVERFEPAAFFAQRVASLESMRRWREAYSRGGGSTRARNLALERFAGSPDLLWAIRKLPLWEPIEDYTKLLLLSVLARSHSLDERWRDRIVRAGSSELSAALSEVPNGFVERATEAMAAMIQAIGRVPFARDTSLAHVVAKGLQEGRSRCVPRYVPLPPWPLPSANGVRLLTTDLAIIAEGEVMHHCVANRVPRALRGHTYIFHVDYAESRATVEVGPRRELRAVFGFANEVESLACDYARRVFIEWTREEREHELSSARESAKRDSDNAAARLNVARALMRTAIAGYEIGLPGARLIFMDAVAEVEWVADQLPDHLEARALHEQFCSLVWVSSERAGDLAVGLDFCLRAVASARRSVDLEPRNPERLRRLIIGLDGLERLDDKPSDARRSELHKAVKKLVSLVPEDCDALSRASAECERLANLATSLEVARDLREERYAYLTHICFFSSDSVASLLEQASACLRYSELESLHGAGELQLKWARRELESLMRLVAAHPARAKKHRKEVVAAKVRVADLERASVR